MADVTIKGRWGDFEYGTVARGQWIVRHRLTGEILRRRQHRSEVCHEAEILHDAAKESPVTVFAWAFDPETNAATRQISYNARNLEEARNWKEFQKNWAVDFVIIDNVIGREVK